MSPVCEKKRSLFSLKGEQDTKRPCEPCYCKNHGFQAMTGDKVVLKECQADESGGHGLYCTDDGSRLEEVTCTVKVQ